MSLKTYRSMRDDEERQLSSSIVMIHMVGAAKMFLKSLPKSLPHAHHAIKKWHPLLAVHTPQIGTAV